MRNLVLVLCVVVFACKSKEPPKPAEPAGSGSGSSAPAPVVVDAAAPGGGYDDRMKAGAALEDQKKWSEALAEFEAALKAKPDDARALAEIGFTAYFASNLDRAKEASIAAVAAAKDDAKLRGSALFNLGLAVEKTMPHAAAALYTESVTVRPNTAVRARLAKLKQNKESAKATPDGGALLAKVGVKPAAAPPPTAKSKATPDDQAMIAALEGAGVEWESGAGKSVLLVENLECRENHQLKPTKYECTTPAVKGKQAQALVAALGGKKVAPVKEHGDVSTFKVASVRCRSFNEGDSGQPDACEVTP